MHICQFLYFWNVTLYMPHVLVSFNTEIGICEFSVEEVKSQGHRTLKT